MYIISTALDEYGDDMSLTASVQFKYMPKQYKMMAAEGQWLPSDDEEEEDLLLLLFLRNQK